MTREETLECIKVMQHYVDGGAVEARAFGNWESHGYPSWNWVSIDYRIKKATKKIKLEAWFVAGELHLVGDGGNMPHGKRVPSEDKWVEVEE